MFQHVHLNHGPTEGYNEEGGFRKCKYRVGVFSRAPAVQPLLIVERLRGETQGFLGLL